MDGLYHYIFEVGLRIWTAMRTPTDYEINNYDHVIFTSDVAWDPTILDNEMDLGILNNNLNLNRGDLHLGARLSDNGEKRTQRIIANMLTKKCYGVKQLSVLNREDILLSLIHI